MGRKRNRKDLGAAQAAGEPVVVRRNIWKADHLEGFVVGLGTEWVVLHVARDVMLDGWSAVRLDTVREVERQGTDCFVARALALAGAEPGRPDVDRPEDLDDVPDDGVAIRGMIATAAGRYPLVTLFTELVDPSVCAIGRPVRFRRSKVEFHDIDSEAVWWDETRTFRYDDITRVDVGGRYETALHQVGGYPPVP